MILGDVVLLGDGVMLNDVVLLRGVVILSDVIMLRGVVVFCNVWQHFDVIDDITFLILFA